MSVRPVVLFIGALDLIWRQQSCLHDASSFYSVRNTGGREQQQCTVATVTK
jgi:hypothetical protein